MTLLPTTFHNCSIVNKQSTSKMPQRDRHLILACGYIERFSDGSNPHSPLAKSHSAQLRIRSRISQRRQTNNEIVRSYCLQSATLIVLRNRRRFSRRKPSYLLVSLFLALQSHLAYGGGGVSVGETILMVVGMICAEDNGGVLPLLNLTN